MRSAGVLTAARGFVAGARRRSWPPLPAKLAIGFLLLLVAAAIAAPWIAPYPPDGIDLAAATQPPSFAHVLGTDQMGRDVLSRLLFSARLSLVIVGAAVLLAGLLGCALGIIAGFSGGVVDAVIMRLTEIQYSLPAIIVALVTVGALGPSITNLVAVIALTNWPRFTRIVRGEAWRLRNRDFILLAHLAGASTTRVLWRHVTPNLLTTIYVLLTLDVGLVVLLEATLSFLGLGVQPPNASWGTMIADGRGYLDRAWWIAGIPGIALLLTVLAANTAGDALRDLHVGRSEGR
jgi:peptide/nickel transport system permease protein